MPRNSPPSRRVRVLTPIQPIRSVPFRFSLSRPISAEDIRSAIRVRNLNKTNQYSNPPLSLADSPSVPFPPFFSPFFASLLYLFLFISISRRTSDFIFSVSFSFAPILHSLVQYRSVSFIRVSFPNRAISFSDLFNFCTHWVSTARMIGFILGELPSFPFAFEEEKIQDKKSFTNNEKIKYLVTKLSLICLSRVFLQI